MVNACMIPAPTPELSAINLKFGVQDPQMCQTTSAKVQNLRRRIASLEENFEANMKLNRRLEYLNYGILTATVVRDLSIGFLDAVGEMIPGKAGKVAKGGVIAIKASGEAAKLAYGQTSVAEAAFQTGKAAVDTIPTKGPLGDLLKSKGQYALNMTDAAIKGAQGDKKGAVTEITRGSINMSLDATIAALASSAVASTKEMAKSLGVIKSVSNTLLDLGTASDDFMDEKDSLNEAEKRIRNNFRQRLSSLKVKLDQALAQLEACSVSQ